MCKQNKCVVLSVVVHEDAEEHRRNTSTPNIQDKDEKQVSHTYVMFYTENDLASQKTVIFTWMRKIHCFQFFI